MGQLIYRSKAPLRISFGGGGTDVSPYPEERGGVVLSATIDKYAYSSLFLREDSQINIRSLDYGIDANYEDHNQLTQDSELALVKAVIKGMKLTQGLDMFIHTDVPPGSGLGSSSTLTVTLVGLIQRCQHLPLTDYDVAELAFHIEREQANIPGGKQDQYSSTFGGFNFIEFNGKNTTVMPLRLKEDLVDELQYRLLLCYTGKVRRSGGIIEDQIQGYTGKNQDVINALDKSKELAICMKNTLLLGQMEDFGDLLHQAWCYKKKFSPLVSTPFIDELYEEARKSGASGGKILGAGGGGHMLLFCPFEKKHLIAERMHQLGASIVSFAFSSKGLTTWSVNGHYKS